MKNKQIKPKQTTPPSSHNEKLSRHDINHERHDPTPVQHSIEVVGWDNIGGGWWLQCLCGWDTAGSQLMETTGQAFDDHLREVGMLKEI